MTNLQLESLIFIPCIALLALWAYLQWRSSYTRLVRVELKALLRIESASPPNSISEARKLLSSESSLVEGCLLQCVVAGGPGDQIYDYEFWIHWPRYWAGIFVFMGLLGTVTGISSAVYNLGSTLNATSSGSLEQLVGLQGGIAGLLSSMKFAFACTLVGLTATIAISALNARFLALSQQIAVRVLVMGSERFIPLYYAEKESQRLREQENILALIQNFAPTLTLLESSATKLAANVIPAAEYFVGVSRDSARLGHDLAVAANALAGESGRATKVYERLETVLTESFALLTKEHQNLERASLSMITSGDQLLIVSGALSAERGTLAQMSETVTTSTREMTATSTNLHKQLLAMQTEQEERLDTLVRKLVTAHEEATSRIEGQLLRFQNEQASITMDIVESIQTRQEVTLGRMQTVIQDLQNTQQERLREQELRLEQISTRTTSLLGDTLRAFQAEFYNAGQRQSSHSTEVASRVATFFEKVVGELRDERAVSNQEQSEFIQSFLDRLAILHKELQTHLRLFERTLLDVAAVADTRSLKMTVDEVQGEIQHVLTLHAKMDSQHQLESANVNRLMDEVARLEIELRQEMAKIDASAFSKKSVQSSPIGERRSVDNSAPESNQEDIP